MSKILDGVVVSLSGYQGAERGDMRSSILNMGAEYSPDFSDKVTHLVCAFAGSTPKIESAKKANVEIVMGEWVEECKSSGKRLPVGNASERPVTRPFLSMLG